jgi:hypothetical protein
MASWREEKVGIVGAGAPRPSSGMAENAEAAFKHRYQQVKRGADDHRSEA